MTILCKRRSRRKNSMKKLILILALFTVLSGPIVKADEVYTFVVKKQEEKQKSRWTLSEWLATRDKMRLMDLWLALHSPSPYEFFISGGYWYIGSGKQSNSIRLSAGAYASIFGLEVQKSYSSFSELLYIFHLRIFGYHAQATNITLQGGIRSSEKPNISRNAMGGIAMSVYLSRYFGLDGVYRHHFGSVPSSTVYQVYGNFFEGGPFIDFKFLRVFGNYFYRPEFIDGPSGNYKQTSSGANIGLKLFF